MKNSQVLVNMKTSTIYARINSGKYHGTMIRQLLEELELHDKLEELDELIEVGV